MEPVPGAALTVGSPALWIGSLYWVLALLALDLGVFHRKSHVVSVREALGLERLLIALAFLFNLGVYHWCGSRVAAGVPDRILDRKALSVDNIFVFLVIFFTSPCRLPTSIECYSSGFLVRSSCEPSSFSPGRRCWLRSTG